MRMMLSDACVARLVLRARTLGRPGFNINSRIQSTPPYINFISDNNHGTIVLCHIHIVPIVLVSQHHDA